MSKLVVLLVVLGTLHLGAQCPPNAQTCVVQVTPSGGTITSATYSHSSAAVVNLTQQATALALVGIFDIAPAMITLHNQRIHAIESRYAGDYEDLESLVAVPTPPSAQGDVSLTMRGYRIHETWADFVADSPLLRVGVEKCKTTQPRKQSSKHQVFDPCADVRYMATGGAGRIVITCRIASASKDTLCKDFDGEVAFVDGKIVGMKMILPTMTVQDAIRELGTPSGADKDSGSMVWHGPVFDAALSQTWAGTGLLIEVHKR